MADHSQMWHDGTSSRNISSNCNTNGLAAVISNLDNLGHDMQKLKENVHTIQVGCQICEGAHLDKECPLNEEVVAVFVRDFYKKFYNSLGKTRGVVIVLRGIVWEGLITV
ncbi:hypothetical protein Tco_0625841 [Tanacetum coccineum]|uniref:Uncharacterized protein n=1 Tax=Tanacetum coccineum TaxID=301880 RepID=A0ABQ4WI03_9ASTR